MSRSRKHIPIAGIAMGTSEKDDKRRANRALRRAVHMDLSRPDAVPEVTPVLREVSDGWSMAKDGKKMFDPVKYPKIMRK